MVFKQQPTDIGWSDVKLDGPMTLCGGWLFFYNSPVTMYSIWMKVQFKHNVSLSDNMANPGDHWSSEKSLKAHAFAIVERFLAWCVSPFYIRSLYWLSISLPWKFSPDFLGGWRIHHSDFNTSSCSQPYLLQGSVYSWSPCIVHCDDLAVSSCSLWLHLWRRPVAVNHARKKKNWGIWSFWSRMFRFY